MIIKLLTNRKFAFSLFFLVSLFSYSQSIAIYEITFTSVWNASDHGTLPTNPHWSDLVGTTHNSAAKFWELGQLATPGIKDVAEEGNNVNFNSEVTTAINAGNANEWLLQGFSPFAAISSATLSGVEVFEDKPLLTLVSMIAPSPDWFIGISDFSLLDTNGDWKTNVSIDMFPYDAGTDDGSSYESLNAPSTPPVPISSLINTYSFNDQKIGTLTITLTSVLSVEDEIAESSKISAYPNPANDHITLTNLAANQIQQIEIFSILGNLVSSQTIAPTKEQHTINTSAYHSGIYFIKLRSGNNNQTITRKVIIN